VTVTAANGAVTIKSAPARIVSLSPTATEDLYAVGAGPQVVAVDQYSDYPAGVPKTSLSGLTPNIEAIAKYNPSLVIASQDSGGLVSGLAKLGVPVLIESAVASVDAAYAQIGQVGQATGHASQAASVVAGMKQQIAADVTQAGSGHGGLTYYWELSANPFYSATSSTFIGQVVGLFGLKNIADAASKPADGGYPELSQEFIVTAKPQVIFLADNQAADGGQSPAVVAKRPGWSGIPAVRDNEVIGLNDDVASRWGPRLPELVAEIAQAVEQASK
jgi:iron complex transport system substrate-binding protein